MKLGDNLQKLRIAAPEAADANTEAFANHVLSCFGPQPGTGNLRAAKMKSLPNQ